MQIKGFCDSINKSSTALNELGMKVGFEQEHSSPQNNIKIEIELNTQSLYRPVLSTFQQLETKYIGLIHT